MSVYRGARAWRDEVGELFGKKTVGARITDNTTEGTTDFADNCIVTTDYKIINVQLNHDKDLTVGLYPHLHWFQASATMPNWYLAYRWQVNGAAKTTAWTPLAYSGNVFAWVSGTLAQITYWATIAAPVGAGLSDIVQFRLTRDTNNASGLFGGADALAGDAAALMFDVHFAVDSNGSIGEYTK